MKPLSTKTQFKEALTYLKESRKYVYTVIILFFLSVLFGFLFKENLTFIDKLLEQLIIQTQNLNTIEMIFFILQNNLLSSFISIVTGIFIGAFPVASTIINGTVLGYVLGLTLDTSSIASWWRLLPHGIFELPAIFISFGIGIKLGFSLFLNKKIRVREFKRRFYNSFNVLLIVVIPLLIIAAIIEGLLISLLP
ncbi:MAG: stage II sporulation protein M [archaeon]